MKAHDIWKSKRFVSEVVVALVSFVLLIVTAYTKVEVEEETVAFIIKGLVYLGGLVVGGFVAEDLVIAAKSGKRAKKYGDNEPS